VALSRTVPVAGGLALGAALLFASPAAAAPSGQDATWLKAAHQYNLTEISAGQAAQSHAPSATVRTLGQMFIADHTAGDAKLQAVAAQFGVSLPGTPDATQQQQLAQASATSGSAFDALFLTSQTSGHRQALAAGATEISSGQDATVLALARATAPVVQHHLYELLAAQAGTSPTSVNAGSGGQAAGSTAAEGAALAALGLVLVAGAGTVVLRRARRSQ